MKKTAVSVLLTALLSASSIALAGPMAPGLWEVTMTSDQMKNMPQLSPEQIAQMKKMGMNVPEMRDGGMVNKICVTPQMAARDKPITDRGQENCKTTNERSSGNIYSADLVCNGPEMKGKGTISVTYSGNTSYSSSMQFKGTAHGQPVNTSNESRGRWLGADCGNVRPPRSMH